MAAAATNATAAAAPRKEDDPKDQDKKRLYVRWEVTDDTLKAAFEKFGKIAETRVVRGPRLRAFGFLTFETEEAAIKAKAEMEGKSIPAGPLEIQYASASGAVRAREKKERAAAKPREAKSPAAAAPAEANGKGADAKRGGRAARGGKAAAPAAGNAKGAKAAAPAADAKGDDAKRGGRKPRRGRGRGAAAAAAGGAAPAPEQKRDSKRDDPNWGKVVRLVPDPIKTPLPADAQLTELNAGPRQYKTGRSPSDAKQIASLVLNADPTKGPFNCSFQLGAFNLKLLEVKVSSRDGTAAGADAIAQVGGAPAAGAAGQKDVRVGCRVVHPDSNRSREVYLRIKGDEHKHKFLELRLPTPKDASGKEQEPLPATVESFFVTIDSIALDLKTGLWKKIMLSLMSMMVPRNPPRPAAAAGAPAAAATDAAAAKPAAK